MGERFGGYDFEQQNNVTNRELSMEINKNFTHEVFKGLPYELQIKNLMEYIAHRKGYSLPEEENRERRPEVIEANLGKPWGGYLTLSKVEKPGGDEVEKILVIRPTPNPIPAEWNTDLPFAQHLMKNLGKLGTSLSVQRHHKRDREEWEVIHGSGYHITSYSRSDVPELDTLEPHRISEGSIVGHSNSTWHSLTNTGPEFLVIAETIFCKPGEPHSEEDIDRTYDLYSRAGTNKNI